MPYRAVVLLAGECCLDARFTARSRRTLRRSVHRLTQPVPRHGVLPEGQLTGAR